MVKKTGKSSGRSQSQKSVSELETTSTSTVAIHVADEPKAQDANEKQQKNVDRISEGKVGTIENKQSISNSRSEQRGGAETLKEQNQKVSNDKHVGVEVSQTFASGKNAKQSELAPELSKEATRANECKEPSEQSEHVKQEEDRKEVGPLKLDEAAFEQWIDSQIGTILSQTSSESLEVTAARDLQFAFKQAFRAYEERLTTMAAVEIPPPPPPAPEFEPDLPLEPDIPSPPSLPVIDRLEGFQIPPQGLRLKPLRLPSEDSMTKEQVIASGSIWKDLTSYSSGGLPLCSDEFFDTFSFPITKPSPSPAPSVEIKEKKFFEPFSDGKEALAFGVSLLSDDLKSYRANPPQIGKELLEMKEIVKSAPVLLALQKLLINKQTGAVTGGIQNVKEEIQRKKEAVEGGREEGEVKLDVGGQVLQSLIFVPRLKERLEACLFKVQFNDKIVTLNDKLEQYELVASHMFALGYNGPLLHVLLLVRQFGNALNYKPNKPDVFGVRTSAIKELHATRSAKKKDYTLFNAMCDSLSEQEKINLIEGLTPCCYLKEMPDFSAILTSLENQMKSLKKAASGSANSSSNNSSKSSNNNNDSMDRFLPVWETWENEIALPLLKDKDREGRIKRLKEMISDIEKLYGEEEGNFARMMNDVGVLVTHLVALKPPPPKEGKGSWNLKTSDIEKAKKIDNSSSSSSSSNTPTQASLIGAEELSNDFIQPKRATEEVFFAEELAPRQFVKLSKIRNNWLVGKKHFLNPHIRADYQQRTNGLQACFAALKTLYDYDHPRWNKLKDLVDVGLVKATKDCGNTSVSMGLAVRFFSLFPSHSLVAFLNGGTDGLKLQFYVKQKDGLIVSVKETKNKIVMFSNVPVSTYVPKDKKKTVSYTKAQQLLVSEMKEAPWKNREIIEKIITEYELEKPEKDVDVPLFAFLTGTIRNHYETQIESEKEEMDKILNSLLKEYALPWSRCLETEEKNNNFALSSNSTSPTSSSYFIPQAREGEFEFVACTAIYAQLDQKAQAAKQHKCVASFGIGAGSCQWMTSASESSKKSNSNSNASGLHAISLEHGMKTTGKLTHFLSAKILETYDNNSIMFDDFLSSVQNALDNNCLPIIALKSGCLLSLTEVNCCKAKKKFHEPNNNELIRKLFIKPKFLPEPIRVFYQWKNDPRKQKISASLSIDESWLGAQGRSCSALQSLICADASKVLGLREQFFVIECVGKDGVQRILENDCTIIVSTADAAWFPNSFSPVESEWKVYGSKPVSASEWDEDDRRTVMVRTKSSLDLERLNKEAVATWWNNLSADKRVEIQNHIATNQNAKACMTKLQITIPQYEWIIQNVPIQKVEKSQ